MIGIVSQNKIITIESLLGAPPYRSVWNLSNDTLRIKIGFVVKKLPKFNIYNWFLRSGVLIPPEGKILTIEIVFQNRLNIIKNVNFGVKFQKKSGITPIGCYSLRHTI